MEIISRKSAIAAGKSRYFTGKPCKNGHTDERHSPSGRCLACIREWACARYANNREGILSGIKDKRKTDQSFAERARSAAKRYYVENKELVISRVKAHRAAFDYNRQRREKYAADTTLRDGTYKWRAENAEKTREIERRYRINNPGKVNAKNAARLAAQRMATPAWADMAKVRAIYEQAAMLGMEVDHTVPIKSPIVCGLHCEANLALITSLENKTKGNRHWPDMP